MMFWGDYSGKRAQLAATVGPDYQLSLGCRTGRSLALSGKQKGQRLQLASTTLTKRSTI